MAKKQQGNFMKTALNKAATDSTPEPVKETGAEETPANIAAAVAAKAKKQRGRPPATAPKTAAPETRLIGGHFAPGVARQFKMLAVEQERTIQDMLGEAINDLFLKYKKKPIARQEHKGAA